MPLDDAMPFLSRNFDNFVELMKQKISAASEWVPPDGKTTYLLNLLAEGQRVTLPEILEVDRYVQAILNKLKPADRSSSTGVGRSRMEGNPVPRTSMVEQRPAESIGLLGMGQRGQLLPEPSRQDYSAANQSSFKMSDMARIRSSDRGGNSNGMYRDGGATSGIDFHNPSVKRALNDLLNSRSDQGPGSARGYF